jgi:molybdate/tungstate transport system substrate-binding protein
MKKTHLTPRHLSALVAACLGIALLATGCSSSAPPSTNTPAPTATIAKGSGPVNVLYAGSLVDLLEKQVSPGFDTSTGYTFQGFGAGSSALSTQIKGKVRQGDVFISASPAVNATLQGSANGDWVSWYATFATSALVLGYNPQSKFAADLKSKPWYTVITEPGFLLGSTDPATDPKGALSAQALNNAATSQNEPALKTLATSNPNIQPEESLVGRLQADQLDAGFFYASEAKAANIPTVPLTGQDLKATYTITELKGAPDAAGAAAFIAYLLGPDGRTVLKKDGYALTTPPTVTGKGVPANLKGVFSK